MKHKQIITSPWFIAFSLLSVIIFFALSFYIPKKLLAINNPDLAKRPIEHADQDYVVEQTADPFVTRVIDK